MRRLLTTGILGLAGLGWAMSACVGDTPSITDTNGSPDAAAQDSATGASDTGTSADTAPVVLGDAGDGGVTPGGPRCDPTKAFTEVSVLKGISTDNDEHGVWVSADELTAYVAATPKNNSTSKIQKATRTSRDLDFSAPVDAPELAMINAAAAIAQSPSMTSDGLVFLIYRANSTAGPLVSVRANTGAVFPTPVPITSRASTINDGDPFLSADGENIFCGNTDVRALPRDKNKVYGDGGFVDWGIGGGVNEINAADPIADRRAVVSSDRLTIVFASNRAPGSGTDTDLYIATRAGSGGTFSAPKRITVSASAATDLPGTISEDGCLIYFTSNRAGGFGESDVYIAKRPR